MEKINLCLKEWNSVVEALGHGKQSILIRKYGTHLDKFLLYPSSRYVKNREYLKSFQEKYHDFVEKYSVPVKGKKKVEIKYYAKCETVIKKPNNKLKELQNYSLWTETHVKDYLNNKDINIWLLRVYKLKTPVMVPIKVGQLYSKLSTGIDVEDSEPVLTEQEFLKIKESINLL